MSDNPRTDIIAKVRRASTRSEGTAVALTLEQLGRGPRPTLLSDNLAECFLANVLMNKGTVALAANKTEATKAVAAHLYNRFRTRKLVAGNDPNLASMPWRDGGVLPRFGAAADGDLASISYARLGVAETGSVVIWTGKANPSNNHLLVEDHIVLIDTEHLVGSLEQAWRLVEESQPLDRLHRGVTFISAPSSTADIDFQLVMGAHGPRHWHIILMGELPQDTLDNAHRLAGLSRAQTET